MDFVTFGILTVSDTCSRNEKEDTAGPRLQFEINKNFPKSKFFKNVVPDDINNIKLTLEVWIKHGFNVIFTVGGVGFSSRDVTPEATRAVIQRETPGITYTMLSKSLAITEMAMLSRAVCGINAKTLIINLPGSTKAALECFGFIKNALPQAIAVLTDKEMIDSNYKWIQEHAGTSVSAGTSKTSSETPTESKVKLVNIVNRNRKSYPVIEVNAALQKILSEGKASIEWEELDFKEALNRILAEDVYATEPVPPFRASIKDGYAVRTSDGIGDRTVRHVAAAGDTPFVGSLNEGEVVRICTGAPIPLGADAVVQVEETTLFKRSEDGSQELVVKINVVPQLGQHIREIGSDIATGELVLQKFERISPACVGVLAMMGQTRVKVFKRASVGIISTGNELKAPNEKLKPGQIRDCNKITLTSLLKRYSYNSNDCGIAKDNPNNVKFILQKALETNDVVITTGGVLVKQVLEEDFNAYIHFARVNMKPGKHTTFSTLSYKGKFKIVFVLPGNPVSWCITSLLFVIPLLRYIERSRICQFPIVQANIEGLINPDKRPEYHRVRVISNNGQLYATSTGNQISSRLNSLAGANGLAIVYQSVQDPKGRIRSGTRTYKVVMFDDF